MDKNVDLIMINQQEEEQLASQGVPNVRNPAMYISQCSS